ncbi:uncharacterized protein isoform X2 [Leptinotarsa decemlineata]|uniref:uncharacterized protein isoform X2 n=1 Tax=Leptinotarsa decemlineata TaxID=7539 RepID=UPI003D307867
MSDREEGEIVDDDFEDISDNSIIVPCVTNSDANKIEEQIVLPKPTKRRSKCYRKRRCRHEKKNPMSQSDSDDHLNHKLHKHFKAAVHIQSDTCHKNSLHSRLRAMTKLNKSSTDELIERSDKLESDQKPSSDEGDDELIQLRLEALRTAVLNKYQNRKKRKREILPRDDIHKSSVNTDTSQMNKDNTYSENDEQTNKKPCLENNLDEAIEVIDITPPDEDEDVLRALLLASMSKKITKVMDSKKSTTTIENQNYVKQAGNKTRNFIWPTSVENQIIVPLKKQVGQRNTLKIHPIQFKSVKPIIINVDDDSDSEDDFLHNNIKKDKSNNEIDKTVERFLKEQRAIIESQFELPLPTILNSSHETKPMVSMKQTENSTILEKSSVKLLPKVKQLEYHKLLEKLKKAENKPRTQFAYSKLKNKGILSKEITSKDLPVPKNSTLTNLENLPDIKTDAKALHLALKEMQKRKNGRLQIEEKYVILTPIIKKINEATTERKKYDQEIKKLLEELKEAKKNLHNTHINFSIYVKELIAKKERIEKKNGSKAVVVNKHPPTFTSTPKKKISSRILWN